MEILLLQDVNGIGKKNDLLVVGDGFALNFLLPERKALVATPTVRKRYADQIRKRAEEKESERQFRLNAAAALAGKSLTFTKKITKTGKLYAAISEDHIAKALKDEHGLEVSADSIILKEPIKAVGTFTAKVKMGDAEQSIAVTVKAE